MGGVGNLSIQIEKENQARFLKENAWSPIRWISDWAGGVEEPKADLWDKAKSFEEAHATWARYLEGTQRGAESTATFAREIRNGAAMADVAGALALGAVAVFPAVSSALSQIWEGFAGKLVELSQSAATSLASPQYWTRFAKIGSISASLRATYDLFSKKEAKEIEHNALFAFLGGGLCGGLIPNIPVSSSPFVQQVITPILRRAIPFNYVALDLLGDVSKHYLVDVREHHGEAKGFGIAGAGLAAENVLAILALLPFSVSLWGAIKTALTIDAISIGQESFLQHMSGKKWVSVDPGRFIGMAAWSHSVVVLPLAILGGAIKAVGLAEAVSRTTELGIKYVVFINPSASNFQATINNQNWKNVQVGNTARHASLMWVARFVQSTMGPDHLISMVADEGIGTVTMGMVNAVWPYYEGIPEIWSQGFFEKVHALKTKTGPESLTDYLSHEMGTFSLVDGYLPSPLNMKAVEKLVATTGDQAVAGLFKGYLVYLDEKRGNRTIQEEKIAEYFNRELSTLIHNPQISFHF